MILQIDSDVAFHMRLEAQNRAVGFHCLGSRDDNLFNAPILALAKAIKNVMGGAAEAEVTALHVKAQEAIPLLVKP